MVFEKLENKKLKIAVYAFSIILLCAYYLFSTTKMYAFGDESDLILHAINHLKGIPYPAGRYPSFPIFFYEIFLFPVNLISGSVPSYELALQIARVVNILICLSSTIIFYFCLKTKFTGISVLIGSFLFAVSPLAIFHVSLVKTESLLVLEILILYLLGYKIMHGNCTWKTHVFFAVISGLTVTTKYYPMAPIIYMISVFESDHYKQLSIKKRLRNFLTTKGFYIFSVTSILTILVSWTNLWDYNAQIIENFKVFDPYFINAPSFMRCVDEWPAFPYGRFSYSLIVILPLGMGLITYLMMLTSLFTRSIPKDMFLILGIPAILYFILFSFTTLLRMPYNFSVCLPFIIVSATGFLNKYIVQKIKKKWLKTPIIVGLMGITAYQSPVLNIFWQRLTYYSQANSIFTFQAKLPKQMVWLLTNESTKAYGVDLSDYEKSLIEKKSEYLFVLTSYFHNLCKYKSAYEINCKYFDKLKNGNSIYLVRWEDYPDYPMSTFFKWIDPELEFGFILLKLKQ